MNTPVPVEFLGLGRRFRERIANADDRAVGVMTEIFVPLRKRAERSSKRPRPELLQDATRHWQQRMPAFGLIDSKTELLRKALYIREVRVGAGTWRYDPQKEWSREAGIAILLIELHVATGICQLMSNVVALLPLHALGRWYQRSLDNSEAALILDLSCLAAAYGNILDQTTATRDTDFLCAASSGRWAGSLTQRFSEATQRQEQILNARTFLAGAAA